MNSLKEINAAISKIKKMINDSKNEINITALTGSGISKGSGIPTFRGKDGLWKNYNAMQLATPQAFAQDTKLVWEWYSWRINLILDKKPNPAHTALVDLEKLGLLRWIITQNVDDLHKRAGSSKILQVHGDILKAWCQKCKFTKILSAAPEKPPVCECGNILRPGVVWFGESLDHNTLVKASEIISNQTDILLVIGTSGVVYPVAAFPQEAKLQGALIVEFNLDPTPISQLSDHTILGKSEETLPKFVSKIKEFI